MKAGECIFDHPEQLNALSTIPFFRTGGVDTLRLGGSFLAHAERPHWERELNRHYSACGCQASATALLIAFSLGCWWGGYSYYQDTISLGTAIGIALGFAVLGASVGKVFGLRQANARLQVTIRTIQELWPREGDQPGIGLPVG